MLEGWRPTLAHRLWRAHSDALNRELLARWLPSGSRTVLKTDLFDEAVGRGLYPELAKSADHVVGIDVSEATVRAAKRRYPCLDGRVANVLRLPFDDGEFDAVFSNSTLDHFESHAALQAAVGELARIMGSAGKLIITLDNRLNPIVALRTSKLLGVLHHLGLAPYFLGVTHGPRGLANVLRESGFDVVEMASVMHCPPRPAAELASRAGAAMPGLEHSHIRRVLRFEAMGRWPTRYLTGHFVCALAVKR